LKRHRADLERLAGRESEGTDAYDIEVFNMKISTLIEVVGGDALKPSRYFMMHYYKINN
jgi:hypothetical protein